MVFESSVGSVTLWWIVFCFYISIPVLAGTPDL